MIDAVLNVVVFAVLVLCLVGFGARLKGSSVTLIKGLDRPLAPGGPVKSQLRSATEQQVALALCAMARRYL
jgi:hypothetical protein